MEKHVMIRAPPNSQSLFYNYKGFFSINLMALVDADYRFIFVDVGNFGSNADSGVFKASKFGQRFLNKELNIPPQNSYQITLKVVHCHIVWSLMRHFR